MRARVALAGFLALACIHTWPIARSPAHLSLDANADAQLCAWTLGWIAHMLPRHPSRLFDADIFAPERATLTYSDPMLVPAAAAAPVHWLGGSPILAFNVAMLAGLTLTAWSTWWVARRWTGSDTAALVAGALAAFNGHVLTRLPQIVASYVWTIPVSVVLADRVLDAPDRRTTIALALIVTATAITSPYWMAQVGLVIVAAGVFAIALGRWRSAAALAAALAGGLVLAAPVLWPYVRFARGGATRPLEQVAQFSATIGGYLSSVSRLDARWTAPFYRDDVNVWFAGVAAIALAAIGLSWSVVRGDRRDRRRTLLLVVLAAIGVILSLGPATPFYRWLYAWCFPLRGLRAAARFGYLYLTAIAFLAAAGTRALQRLGRTPRARTAIAIAALAAVTVETWMAPIAVTRFDGVPAIYHQVAIAPDPVRLIELPFYPPDAIFLNGEYVLNATAHWRPVMNGYSGYIPDSYRAWAERLWYFPEARALDAIRDSGATHVMVHLEHFTPQENAAIQETLRRTPWLVLVASDPRGHRLYQVGR